MVLPYGRIPFLLQRIFYYHHCLDFIEHMNASQTYSADYV